ncbi:hypothetical protein ACQHIV_23670 [Kribbella sp. GL6]|uniref:hypothetical protein n=1 Tax=Kribbella sp. GL6 TaxID=3419765 RepID=UPI003D07A1F2
MVESSGSTAPREVLGVRVPLGTTAPQMLDVPPPQANTDPLPVPGVPAPPRVLVVWRRAASRAPELMQPTASM